MFFKLISAFALSLSLCGAAFAHCGGCGTGDEDNNGHRQRCEQRCSGESDQAACVQRCHAAEHEEAPAPTPAPAPAPAPAPEN